MVRACKPPAHDPMRSWLVRRSTMATSTPATSTPANDSSPANISPVGPPPAITTACHSAPPTRGISATPGTGVPARLIRPQRRSHVAPPIPELQASAMRTLRHHPALTASLPVRDIRGVRRSARLYFCQSVVDGQARKRNRAPFRAVCTLVPLQATGFPRTACP